jgi:hypothetical protein
MAMGGRWELAARRCCCWGRGSRILSGCCGAVVGVSWKVVVVEEWVCGLLLTSKLNVGKSRRSLWRCLSTTGLSDVGFFASNGRIVKQ